MTNSNKLLKDRLEIRLDSETHHLLKRRAKTTGQSIGALVRTAVDQVYKTGAIPESVEPPNYKQQPLNKKIILTNTAGPKRSSYRFRNEIPNLDILLSLQQDIDAVIKINKYSITSLEEAILQLMESYKVDFGIYNLRMNGSHLEIKIHERAIEHATANSRLQTWTPADQITTSLKALQHITLDDRNLLVRDIEALRAKAGAFIDALFDELSANENTIASETLYNVYLALKYISQELTTANIVSVADINLSRGDSLDDISQLAYMSLFDITKGIRSLFSQHLYVHQFDTIAPFLLGLESHLCDMESRAEVRSDYFWQAREEESPNGCWGLSFRHIGKKDEPSSIMLIFDFKVLRNKKESSYEKELQTITDISGVIMTALNEAEENEPINKLLRMTFNHRLQHGSSSEYLRKELRQALEKEQVFILEAWYWRKMKEYLGEYKLTEQDIKVLCELYKEDVPLIMALLIEEMGDQLSGIDLDIIEDHSGTITRMAVSIIGENVDDNLSQARIREDKGTLITLFGLSGYGPIHRSSKDLLDKAYEIVTSGFKIGE